MTKEEVITQIKGLCDKFEGGESLFNNLLSTDFFDAPASIRYHNSREGGLALHTLNLYVALCNLVDAFNLDYSDSTLSKMAICANLSKVNFYESYLRNEKQDSGWVQVTSYRVKDIKDRVTFGDLGVNSYMIAKNFVSLNDEETAALCNFTHFGNNSQYMEMSGLMSKFDLLTLLAMAEVGTSYIIEKDD